MQKKALLRFNTAGSVDDGKSTLIGRLLYDSKSVPSDQLKNIEKISNLDAVLKYFERSVYFV